MDEIWKKKEEKNNRISELKEDLKNKQNNLIFQKNNRINKPNFLKQLSFNNNNIINKTTPKKPNLSIILPEENNTGNNTFNNNLMGQGININNTMNYINNNIYGSFNPKFSLPLTCSISTQAASKFSDQLFATAYVLSLIEVRPYVW